MRKKMISWKKSLEESGLLIRAISEAFENEEKNKNEDFLVCY